MTAPDAASRAQAWFSRHDCRLEDLRALVERRTEPDDYPHAEAGTPS